MRLPPACPHAKEQTYKRVEATGGRYGAYNGREITSFPDKKAHRFQTRGEEHRGE